MKARRPFRCERCKRVHPTGTAKIRRHGHDWCLDCTVAYLRERRRLKTSA